jgi:hypothetical protein
MAPVCGVVFVPRIMDWNAVTNKIYDVFNLQGIGAIPTFSLSSGSDARLFCCGAEYQHFLLDSTQTSKSESMVI